MDTINFECKRCGCIHFQPVSNAYLAGYEAARKQAVEIANNDSKFYCDECATNTRIAEAIDAMKPEDK